MKPSPHFSKDFLMAQKAKLLKLREELLNRLGDKDRDSIAVDTDEVIEEGDQAQAYLNQNITFGLRARELHQLREIEAALDRIHMGCYGICEETDEPIGIKRLEKMPWTRLSIHAAEADEREKSQYQKAG